MRLFGTTTRVIAHEIMYCIVSTSDLTTSLQHRHGRLGDMTGLGPNNLINNPIIHRLLRRHEKIPIAIGLDLLLRLIAIIGNISIQHLPDEQNLLRLNLDIGRLPLRPSERLMNHDPGIGKRPPLPRSSRPQEKRSHRRGHAEADRGDIAGDVLHGVVDGHAGADRSAGGVDVEGDVLGGILVREVEELGDEDVGDFVVDALTEEDDPVLEEAGEDVFLGGAIVDYGHADGAAAGLLVGVFAAGVYLRIGLAGRRRHADGIHALVLIGQGRSAIVVVEIGIVVGIHLKGREGGSRGGRPENEEGGELHGESGCESELVIEYTSVV
mmetsp:Transcript_1781/g.3399  ORF Transcript_1781/g.3399 Transcript_1781/m.3399 type:complete len:325 (+) Transcript_1781:136-1110(+)